MRKAKQIATTIDMDGLLAEVFMAKFNQQVELCNALKVQNEVIIADMGALNQKIIDSQEPRIYFIEDLCRIYGVSENTIHKYRKLELLDCCDVGQKVWFTQEHLDDFNRRTDSRYKHKLKKTG